MLKIWCKNLKSLCHSINKVTIQQESRPWNFVKFGGKNAKNRLHICSTETGLLTKFVMELHSATVHCLQFGALAWGLA